MFPQGMCKPTARNGDRCSCHWAQGLPDSSRPGRAPHSQVDWCHKGATRISNFVETQVCQRRTSPSAYVLSAVQIWWVQGQGWTRCARCCFGSGSDLWKASRRSTCICSVTARHNGKSTSCVYLLSIWSTREMAAGLGSTDSCQSSTSACHCWVCKGGFGLWFWNASWWVTFIFKFAVVLQFSASFNQRTWRQSVIWRAIWCRQRLRPPDGTQVLDIVTRQDAVLPPVVSSEVSKSSRFDRTGLRCRSAAHRQGSFSISCPVTLVHVGESLSRLWTAEPFIRYSSACEFPCVCIFSASSSVSSSGDRVSACRTTHFRAQAPLLRTVRGDAITVLWSWACARLWSPTRQGDPSVRPWIFCPWTNTGSLIM